MCQAEWASAFRQVSSPPGASGLERSQAAVQSAAASALGATPLGGGAVQGARLARAWPGGAGPRGSRPPTCLEGNQEGWRLGVRGEVFPHLKPAFLLCPFFQSCQKCPWQHPLSLCPGPNSDLAGPASPLPGCLVMWTPMARWVWELLSGASEVRDRSPPPDSLRKAPDTHWACGPHTGQQARSPGLL